MSRFLVAAFWLWSAFIAVVAGFLGSRLNCEHGCSGEPREPSWVQPRTWGDYYVYPKPLFLGLAGLGVASVFVALVLAQRRLLATCALLASLALLSYPFFAGLTIPAARSSGSAASSPWVHLL